jgi:hypothetical protein
MIPLQGRVRREEFAPAIRFARLFRFHPERWATFRRVYSDSHSLSAAAHALEMLDAAEKEKVLCEIQLLLVLPSFFLFFFLSLSSLSPLHT